jgi:SAM-dependent methyltransferase
VVNREHLELCSSPEWRDLLRDEILPYALSNAYLGDHVVEIGPGPGLATELLRDTARRVTAVELDRDLANALAARFAGTNVDVVHADGTNMPFEDGRFTGAIALTMLHHIPTTQLQDRLFREIARVLQPDGQFVASDGTATAELAAFHVGDTYNPVDPGTLRLRLQRAGFIDVDVRMNPFGWAGRGRRRGRPEAGSHIDISRLSSLTVVDDGPATELGSDRHQTD